MKNLRGFFITLCMLRKNAILFLIILLITSCNNSKDNHSTPPSKKAVISRPGSSNNDTLYISTSPVVVFYNPDPKELDSIKLITKPNVFQSQTHEFFFQMRNARIVMKKNWVKLNQIATDRHRYISFKNESMNEVVDLNSFEDYSGMILWDGHKKPHKIDMMSVETELGYYFKK